MNPSSPTYWKHYANEWADYATSGLQWVRNIADGTSDAATAKANMEQGLAYVRSLPAPIYPNELTLSDLEGAVKVMERLGGGFASSIAAAWHKADSKNRSRLEATFADLFQKYHLMNQNMRG